MNNVCLYIESIDGSFQKLDIFDNDISLNKGVKTLLEFEKVKALYSNSINLVDNDNNNIILKGIKNWNKVSRYTFENANARLCKGNRCIIGKLLLIGYEKNGQQSFYRTQFVGTSIDWFSDAKELLLCNINLGNIEQFDRAFVESIIAPNGLNESDTEAWTADKPPVWFPLISFGNWAENWVSFNELKPAVFLLPLITQGFKQLGYRVKSNFLQTDFFRRLLLPYTTKGGKTEQVINRGDLIYVGNNNNIPILELPQNFTGHIPNSKLIFEHKTPQEQQSGAVYKYYDFNNNYDNVQGIYTEPQNGVTRKFGLKLFFATFDPASAGDDFSFLLDPTQAYIINSPSVKIHVYKNGQLFASYSEADNTLTGGQLDGDILFTHFLLTVWYAIQIKEIEIPLDAGDQVTFELEFDSRNSLNEAPPITVHFDLTNSNPENETNDNFLTTNPEREFIFPEVAKDQEGGFVSISEFVPCLKFSDYFIGLVHLFNWYVETDPESKVITIEPRDQYLEPLSSAEDWTEKVDCSELDINYFANQKSKNTQVFKYKNDGGDYELEQYKIRTGNEKYEGSFVLSNEKYETGEDESTNKFFAPTVDNYSDTTISSIAEKAPIIPKIWNDADGEKPYYNHVPRLLYKIGYGQHTAANLEIADWMWYEDQNFLDRYPKAKVYEPSLVNLSFADIEGNLGLLSRFYSGTIQELNNAFVIKINIEMTLEEFMNTNFRTPKKIVYNGEVKYFYLLEVKKFIINNDKALAEVEFLTIPNG